MGYKEYLIKRTINKKICLFGMGSMGLTFAGIMKREGFAASFFADNDPRNVGRVYDGITCISIENMLEIADDIHVLITVGNPHEIFAQLRKYEKLTYDVIKTPYIFDFDRYMGALGEEAYSSLVNSARERFVDKRSKLIFDCVIKNRLTTDYMPNEFTEIQSDSPQYLESDLVSFDEDSIFVDCGAFVGDTLASFIRHYKGAKLFKKWLCIEPNRTNYMMLADYVKNDLDCDERIRILNIGVGESETIATVSDTSGGSSVNHETGRNSEIQIKSIDSLLPDEKVTHIKMDIEGLELEALKGASRTIQKDHPVLMICVYHKASDLWDIPSYISSIDDHYKFYLRHYTTGLTETVLYAVHG